MTDALTHLSVTDFLGGQPKTGRISASRRFSTEEAREALASLRGEISASRSWDQPRSMLRADDGMVDRAALRSAAAKAPPPAPAAQKRCP